MAPWPRQEQVMQLSQAAQRPAAPHQKKSQALGHEMFH